MLRIKVSALYVALIFFSFLGYPTVAGFSAVLDVGNASLSIFFRIILLALALLLIIKRFGGVNNKKQQWILIIGVVFWLMYFSRLVASTIVDHDQLSLPYFDYWVWSIGASFIPFLALALGPPREISWNDIGRKFFVITFIISVLVSIKVSTYTMGVGEVVDTGRMRLDALNPISLGHLGGTLFLMSLWAAIFAPNYGKIWRSMVIVGAALSIYFLLGSNSRGPLVATAASVIYLLGISRPRGALIIFLVLIPMIFIAPIATLYFQELTNIPVHTRMFGKSIVEDASTLGRIDLYGTAFADFIENPLLGAGVEGRGVGSYPHNVVIEAFLATGLIGGFVFLGMLVLCVFVLYRGARRSDSLLWLSLICFQYIIGAQFSGALYSATYFWAALGVAAMISAVVNRPGLVKIKNTRGTRPLEAEIGDF